MKVKEIIYEKLVEECKIQTGGITSSELASKLEMRRNLVSQYLNELVREKKVWKEIGRPVYFRPYTKVESELEETQKHIVEKDVFANFVGSYGSMKNEIDQCRSAVQYPNKGLPILLNGCSGVGKSFLAELIYKYAKHSGVIEENAPFITLNCADYASNPELLSAMLFGYIKGAFTGADKDKDGLIAQADQGYLFLDEVHRLNSESQEKLFLLMDKDEYRKIGETKESHKAYVRLLFATTEDPDKVLIHTLRRRIPMIVRIPSLQDRPVKEKLELIQLFFYNESKIFKKAVKINAQAINLLLSLKAEGNIGSLQNTIRYSCAYSNHANDQEDYIYVDTHCFPADSKLYKVEMREYVKEDMMIDYKGTMTSYDSFDNTQGMQELLQVFYQEYNTQKKEFVSFGKIQKSVYQVFETLHIKEVNPLTSHLVDVVIENFERENGIHVTINTGNILCGVLEAYQNVSIPALEQGHYEEALKLLEEYSFKIYSLAEKLISLLTATLGITLQPAIRFYITLFLMITNRTSKAACYNALIMAHGNSTASSIASVANEMLSEFLFEAFDMPIHTSFELFITLLKKYLDRINKNYPTLILVDMGSLLEIDKHMEVDEYQEIGIIDNISTSLALEVGNRLRQGEHLSTFLPEICEHAQMHYRYIQPKVRKKAIICVCISGVGTAEKIKSIISDFIQEDVELLAYDYMRVLKEGKNCRIFKEYDVQCLIGTSDISVKGIDCININHLMDNEDERDIRIFMEKVICENEHTNMEQVQQKIIKEFSLENLINRLVFLNPQTIIDDVEKMIFDTEMVLQMKFDSDTRMMLFLHIAVLIERALLKNCEEDIYQEESWLQRYEHQINLISSAFMGIQKKFNIMIPKAEIVSILYMIQMKQQVQPTF